jgi:hypothetical protein
VTQVIDTPAPIVSADAPPEEEVKRGGPVVHLNAFQILMRRWSKLHPYNAGQVMQVTGAPDKARWKQAAERVIHELGLGKPRFTGGDYAVQFLPVPEISIELAQNGHSGLEAFFNEELNRAFAAGDLPIRFCILPGPAAGAGGEESHYFAAVYDHWIADSRAMRELMHRIFDRYRAADGVATLPALTLEAAPFAKLFKKHISFLPRFQAMRESLKNIWRHRNGFRLNLRNPLDFATGFVMRELPEGLIDRLHGFAKERKASVNDLFIAAIAQTMGAYTAPDRLNRTKKPFHFSRRKIGIGTIVDIRGASADSLDRVFNLYLSSYTVLVDNPENRTADDLTRAVAAETCRVKKSLATVRGYFALGMARFWYDVYDSPRFRASLLHKTVPVVAGISNVNMTHSWADSKGAEGARAEEPRVLDYLRISPAGPLIPVVFTLTTIRGRLSLCVTYRKTSFNDAKLLELVNDLMRRLELVSP